MTNKSSQIPSDEPTALDRKPKRPLIESLRDALTLVSAGAGVFAVLFYLAGRSFSGGYFGQMNIPSYQISFSLLEYSELAWVPLFVFPLLVILIVSFLAWAVFTLKDLFAPLFVLLIGKILLSKRPKRFTLDFSKITMSRETKLSFFVLFWTFVAFVGMFLILGLMTFTDSAGRNAGRKTILENAQTVELVSAIPLALDDNNLAPVGASGQAYYIYTGFHLLTFNSGKYYLFKEIDPVTCKPLKVYIIDSEKDLQVNLSVAQSLVDQCQMTNPPTATPTSTSVQPTP